MKTFALLAATALALTLTACASMDDDHAGERFGNDVDTVNMSKADGAAYVSDAMSLRQWEPVHPATNDIFYFKKCNEENEKTYYSMTSYDCNEP